jgi:hypothetical protein
MAKKKSRQNNMQLGGIGFFFFWGESGSVGFLLFSLCSHQVPNVFPKMFPIVLHPISFALNSTYNYITNPKEEIPTYLFWICLKFDEFFFVIGQSKMPITKENEFQLWWSPQLMNMSYHKIPPNSHTQG